jgi:nucleoid-associated protein YgaU
MAKADDTGTNEELADVKHPTDESINAETVEKSGIKEIVATLNAYRTHNGTSPFPHDHIVYEVEKGDYLFKITKAYTGRGYDYPKIQKDNQIPNADLIFPGQLIKIRREWLKDQTVLPE